MQKTLPLITIGITCFNAQDTIIRTIESARAQTWGNTQIIIVDDCSSDKSATIVQNNVKDEDNITFVKHDQNKGFPGALNTIMKHARGEFIAFFDDDDVSASDRLSRQHEKITQYESQHQTQSVLCYSNRNIVLPNDNKIDHIALAIGRTPEEPHGHAVADFLLWHTSDRDKTWGLFGSCTLLTRTKLINDIGGFDENFRRSAEWDLAVRLAQKEAHFIAVDAPLITQGKTMTSDKAGKIPLRYALALRRKHKPYLKKKKVYLIALCLTHSGHYHGKNKRIRSVFFMALACILGPKKVFWEKVRHKLKTLPTDKPAIHKSYIFSKAPE